MLQILSIRWWLRPKKRPAKYPLATAERVCCIIDSFFVVATLLSFICAFIFGTRISIGFVFLFAGAYFLYLTYLKVEATEMGLVFQKDDWSGTVKPGWHSSLLPFWEIRKESSAVQRMVFKNVTMNLKSGTKITISEMAVYYKIVNFKKFAITIEEPKKRLFDETLAKVKGVMGNMVFTEKQLGTHKKGARKKHAVVSEKNFVENEVKKQLNKEMETHGIEIEDIPVVDFSEDVFSKAEELIVLKKAQAVGDGAIAKELAGALENNKWAAIAQIGGEASKAITELAKALTSSKKGGKK